MNKNIPIKTIERLSLYRRILKTELKKSNEYIFSYRLASLSNRKPAQIRRDLMFLEQIASTQKGYKIIELVENIENILNSKEKQKLALVGVGNMGRAFINYFSGRDINLIIDALFDIDPEKINRVISGCRCYHVDELERIISENKISIGMIAVPETLAQNIAYSLAKAGVRGIINITNVPIKVHKGIHVENIDLITALEKTAYLTNNLDENRT